MDLHGQIMNLNCKPENMDAEPRARLAYKVGHRDARHAAAGLANEHASMAEELRREVERCFDVAQLLDAMNPTLQGSFTGTPSERIRRQIDAGAVKPKE